MCKIWKYDSGPIKKKKKNGYAVNLLFGSLFTLRGWLDDLWVPLEEGGCPLHIIYDVVWPQLYIKKCTVREKQQRKGEKTKRNYRMSWFRRAVVWNRRVSVCRQNKSVMSLVWYWHQAAALIDQLSLRRMFQLNQRLGQPCWLQSIIQVIQQTFTCLARDSEVEFICLEGFFCFCF